MLEESKPEQRMKHTLSNTLSLLPHAVREGWMTRSEGYHLDLGTRKGAASKPPADRDEDLCWKKEVHLESTLERPVDVAKQNLNVLPTRFLASTNATVELLSEVIRIRCEVSLNVTQCETIQSFLVGLLAPCLLLAYATPPACSTAPPCEASDGSTWRGRSRASLWASGSSSSPGSSTSSKAPRQLPNVNPTRDSSPPSSPPWHVSNA